MLLFWQTTLTRLRLIKKLTHSATIILVCESLQFFARNVKRNLHCSIPKSNQTVFGFGQALCRAVPTHLQVLLNLLLYFWLYIVSIFKENVIFSHFSIILMCYVHTLYTHECVIAYVNS